jgi:hypothetical protein
MEYDLTLYTTITKTSGKIFYDGANTFGGIPKDASDKFQAVCGDLAKHFQATVDSDKVAGYKLAVSLKVIDENGQILVPSEPRAVFNNVSRENIVKAEEMMVQAGVQLFAKAKELGRAKKGQGHK